MPPQPLDFGPIYKETDLSHWLAEPWNAFSSLSFWIPVFYFGWKIQKNYKNYLFLLSCMPFLFIGGLGSTLFHAFRRYPIFLVMDWLPIMILSLMIMVYFWYQILKKWSYTILVVLFTFVLRALVFELIKPYHLPKNAFININYTITTLVIAAPLTVLLIQTKGKNFIWLIGSGICFALAIFFRIIDREQDWITVGTHWLWHIFCAVGAFFLAQYLYLYQTEKTGRACTQNYAQEFYKV
ncbi:MAG: ceramidase [Bacteroidia bacterium]|nr:ceramidase [Bacteroidia bacterium]MDW8300939.1 ceramidase domain-containing protein [Bacteroidia bacterium]